MLETCHNVTYPDGCPKKIYVYIYHYVYTERGRERDTLRLGRVSSRNHTHGRESFKPMDVSPSESGNIDNDIAKPQYQKYCKEPAHLNDTRTV